MEWTFDEMPVLRSMYPQRRQKKPIDRLLSDRTTCCWNPAIFPTLFWPQQLDHSNVFECRHLCAPTPASNQLTEKDLLHPLFVWSVPKVRSLDKVLNETWGTCEHHLAPGAPASALASCDKDT